MNEMNAENIFGKRRRLWAIIVFCQQSEPETGGDRPRGL
jgi:hypothetical protein